MSNFKKLVEARMAETGEGWQAASKHVRGLVLAEEEEAAKAFVRKLKAAATVPYGKFVGPRTIEPGQTLEIVDEMTADDWPWSPTHLEFIPTLRGQSLFVESMTVGRRDQMHGEIPIEAFIGVDQLNMRADMVTIEKPLKLKIRNAGARSQLIIGHFSGIAHVVPFEPPFEAHDIDRVSLLLENAAVPAHTTKTMRVAPPKPAPTPESVGARAFLVGGREMLDDVEYKIARFMMPTFENVFVDVLVDGESVTGGFVESRRFDFSTGRASDFNLDRAPIEFKKPYVKGKTQFEVVVRNDSDHPHDMMGFLDLSRHLTMKEIEEKQAERRNTSPRVLPHSERFPWNIDGKKEVEAVAPGETKTLAGQPQCIFKGKELVVDPECRDDFEIVDIKVGVDPSDAFDKPIPAARFHENNGIDVKLETASPGIIMRLIVKNISKETRDFGATLKGDAIF